MRRVLSVLMIAIFCLSFSACIAEDAPTKETGETPTSAAKTDEKFGLNETAVFHNLKLTATEIKETDGTGFFVPEDGNVFVGVKFTVENISDEEQTISSLLMFEGYVDDVKCDYSFSAACAFDEGTLDGSVAVGKKLVGWYAVEVPRNWSTIELQVQPSLFSNNSAKFVFSK